MSHYVALMSLVRKGIMRFRHRNACIMSLLVKATNVT